MVDWTKPIQTRDGRKARLLGRINAKRYPYVVALEREGEDDRVAYYSEEGGFYFEGQHPSYIVNVPSRESSFQAVMCHGDEYMGSFRYDTLKDAISNSNTGKAIEIVRVSGKIKEVILHG